MKKMRRNLPPFRSIRGRGTTERRCYFSSCLWTTCCDESKDKPGRGSGYARGDSRWWSCLGCCVWWHSLCTGRGLSAASIKSTPETLTVTFEGFSPTHDFFDYTGKRSALPQPPHDC